MNTPSPIHLITVFGRKSVLSLLGLMMLWGGLVANAQTAEVSENILKGKTIAVFFSKKNFSFTDHYPIELAQFISSEEGADPSAEDLRQQTLIVLAEMFCQQAETAMEADSVYFLSQYAVEARAFLDQYSSAEKRLSPMGEAMGQTDYILVVSPLMLGSYMVSSVYTRSNRLITERIPVKTARAIFTLYEPATGRIVSRKEVCLDDRKTKVPTRYYDFNRKASKTGDFLGKIFSVGTTALRGEAFPVCAETEE